MTSPLRGLLDILECTCFIHYPSATSVHSIQCEVWVQYDISSFPFVLSVKRDAYVNRFGHLGWETERKVTPQSSRVGKTGEERSGEGGGDETGEERWRGGGKV